MFNLDPGKLLVIAVVAIILLGPDKLPQFARQVGGAWRSFNEFRHRMEAEVRNTMPDLPPTSEIARLARSPSALLNHLSTMSSDEEQEEAEDGEADGSFQPPLPPDAAAGTAGNATGNAAGAASSNGARPHRSPSDAVSGSPPPVAAEPAEPDAAGGPDVTSSTSSTSAATSPVAPSAAPEAIVPGDPTLN